MKKHIDHIKELISDSIKVKQSVLNSNANTTIYKMAQLIANAMQNGNKLLLCGNGGSSADAQHLAAELTIRLRSNFNRKALPAIALATDSSTLTACANDFEFENIFHRMTEALGTKGDVLLGISSSGNSTNVNKALKQANSMGIKTISFLGKDGGNAKGLCDLEYIVASHNTGRIQESHIMIGHILIEIIEDILKDSQYI